MRLIFPCDKSVDPESGQVILECRRPSAFAFGSTLQEALDDMHSLLLDLLVQAYADKRVFPMPMEAEEGDVCAQLSPIETLKVFLINAMIETHTRPVDIAERLGITRQEVTRITNPKYRTKLDTIDRAIEATGKRLRFSFA